MTATYLGGWGNRMGSELFFQEVVSLQEICGADKFQHFFSNS